MSEDQKIEVKDGNANTSKIKKRRRTISAQLKTILATTLITLAAVAILFGAWHLIFHKTSSSKSGDDLSSLKTAQQSINFPVYYPKPQPQYKLQHNSASSNANFINFNYLYGPDTITVTEQPVPPVIEQVTKTRNFDTPVGKGYLADLNGHTAGFIQTKKTLIILSSQNNIGDKLQTLMSNFKKL